MGRSAVLNAGTKTHNDFKGLQMLPQNELLLMRIFSAIQFMKD